MIGVQIIQVQPGTVVGHDHEGREMVVTETSAVCNGDKMWVTPTVYAKLKSSAALDEDARHG